MNSYLDLLPNDMYLEILSHFSKKDLSIMELVNKRARDLSRHAYLWQPRLKKDFFCKTPFNKKDRNYYIELTLAKKQLIYLCLESFTSHEIVQKIGTLSNRTNKPQLKDLLATDINEYTKNQTLNDLQSLAKKYDCEINFENEIKIIHPMLCAILSLPRSLTQDTINFITLISVKERALSTEEKNQFRQIFDEQIFNKYFAEDNIDYQTLARIFLEVVSGIFAMSDETLFNLLLEKHPNLTKITFSKKDGCSMLHTAIVSNNFSQAKQLIERGADINLVDVDIFDDWLTLNEISVLHLEEGYASPLYDFLNFVQINKLNEASDFLDYLLEKGADPNKPCLDFDSDTVQTPFALCKHFIECPQLYDHHPKFMEMCKKIISVAKAENEKNEVKLISNSR